MGRKSSSNPAYSQAPIDMVDFNSSADFENSPAFKTSSPQQRHSANSYAREHRSWMHNICTLPRILLVISLMLLAGCLIGLGIHELLTSAERYSMVVEIEQLKSHFNDINMQLKDSDTLMAKRWDSIREEINKLKEEQSPSESAVEDLSARVATLETRQTDLAASLATLDDSVTAQADTAARVTAVESRLTDGEQASAGFQTRLDDLQTSVNSAITGLTDAKLALVEATTAIAESQTADLSTVNEQFSRILDRVQSDVCSTNCSASPELGDFTAALTQASEQFTDALEAVDDTLAALNQAIAALRETYKSLEENV